MKRLFWVTVGVGVGYYAARRGEAVVERARERGVVGNVTLAASTATKVAGVATRTAATLSEKARAAAAERTTAGPVPSPAPGPVPSGPAPSSTPSTSREVRP